MRVEHIGAAKPSDNDYFAYENELRVGRYPGRTVAKFNSHWEAVEAMLRKNGGKDEG